MDIRPMGREDWPRIPALVARAIRAGSVDHYSRAQADAWTRTHGLETIAAADHAIVAVEGGDLLGVAGTTPAAVYPLSYLFVDPAHWRRGAGRGLVKSLERFCAERGVLSMDVAAAQNALEFYRALGYARGGSMRVLFGDEQESGRYVGIAAVAMWKLLDPATPRVDPPCQE